MKKTFRLFLLSGLCSSTLLWTDSGWTQGMGLYLKADAGANWTSDTELKEFFGPVTPGSEVEFDPGFRLGVAVGYDVTPFFAVEGQLGIFENYIDSITDAERVDAVFTQFPFLVNVRFQCPKHWCVTPYFGGGLGGSVGVIDADRITIGDTSMEGTESSDTVFAYQAFGGLRFNIAPNMGVSLEYRYFHADGVEWESDIAFGTASDEMRFGDTEVHAVSVAFEYKF
jgi:opacity protein-like surface antigen